MGGASASQPLHLLQSLSEAALVWALYAGRCAQREWALLQVSELRLRRVWALLRVRALRLRRVWALWPSCG